MLRSSVPLLLLAIASAVPAQAEARDFCPERPGLDTPACVLDAGRVQLEAALGDWTLERDAATRTDTVVAGDLLLRYGLDAQTEAQIGWSAYGHVRTRDRITGGVEHRSGTGDVTFAIKRNLIDPGGEKVSIALRPAVTLPVGGGAIGAGDWGAGLLVPVSAALTDTLSLLLTPEIDAAVDEDGDGRHLSYGTAGGVQLDLSDALSGSIEMQAIRDRDPAGHHSKVLAAASLGWTRAENLQLDVGAVVGLNRDSADLALSFGIARRF